MRGVNRVFAKLLAVHGASNGFMNAATDPAPGVVPTAPGPGDVYRVGGNCTFKWNADPSGLWKETNVQLMSGDNFNMIHITTVATFDGTDASQSELSYPCPEVKPNSAIYFYQFSTSAAPANLTWTTRWTIAAADGSTTPPANDTQPNGAKIPWGVGALVDPSLAVPPPSYLSGGPGSSSSSSSSSSPSSSSSSSSSAAGSAPTSSASPDQGPSSSAATTTSTVTVTPQPSGGNDPQNQNGNGTGGAGNSALGAQVNLVVGAVAMALTAVVFGIMS